MLDNKDKEHIKNTIQSAGGELSKKLIGAKHQDIEEALVEVGIQNVPILNLSKKQANEDQNALADVAFLIRLDLSHLKQLKLNSNQIKDIHWLNNANFAILERLFLSDNLIEDASPVTAPALSTAIMIELNGNRISDISFISRMNLTNLMQLSIAENPVTDAKVVTQVDFKNHPKFKLLLCENPLSEESRATIHSLDESARRRIFQWFL